MVLIQTFRVLKAKRVCISVRVRLCIDFFRRWLCELFGRSGSATMSSVIFLLLAALISPVHGRDCCSSGGWHLVCASAA